MRLLNEKYEEIAESDIDLSRGRVYVTTIIRPSAKPVDDVTKFAYEDSDYETVRIYEQISEAMLAENQVNKLKKMLSDTDYVIIKMAEGAALADEYAEILVKRQMWREEIKAMESR